MQDLFKKHLTVHVLLNTKMRHSRVERYNACIGNHRPPQKQFLPEDFMTCVCFPKAHARGPTAVRKATADASQQH